MRIAILSDVHANIEALSEVEMAIGKLAPEVVMCLGDVVGYGASPNECCEVVRRISQVVLLGNHDAAVAGRMDYTYYYDAARRALDWTAARISPENLVWLRSLPYTHRIGQVGFSHGSPILPAEYEYVFALEQARELLPHFQRLPEVTFIGHSHLCKGFSLSADGEVSDVGAPVMKLDPEKRYIVSVGSVGQPRDYDNRACFVAYDTEARRIEYHRVAYDIEKSAQRIFDAKLAANFGRRLFLGV
jgi:diadenosine tetraphosphatase ApaH/serine/threonine PP2A family protein phosphatase